MLGFLYYVIEGIGWTLSPEPPGIFRFGLAPAGTGPGPVGCP